VKTLSALASLLALAAGGLVLVAWRGDPAALPRNLLVGANLLVVAVLVGANARWLHRARAARRHQALALEDTSRELEALAHAVAHELRAPLRQMITRADSLHEATGGQLEGPARRDLAVLREAGDDMDQLIGDLLAFSHAARAPLREERVSMAHLVTETVHRLERETQDRRLLWRLPPLPDVVGDATLLRQVLANLLGNALKFTRDRNPAEIEVGCAGREADRVIFFVRDNGTGFEPQLAHRLFGVFQRLHRPGEFGGTGIGLALVRRIIARHGGRTWAEGAVNRGATVYFTLAPATGTAPAPEIEASATPQAGEREPDPVPHRTPLGLPDRRSAYPATHYDDPGAGPA
jgi:light-regulated signal transduction histidine kinase (bacteriophytochrome)